MNFAERAVYRKVASRLTPSLRASTAKYVLDRCKAGGAVSLCMLSAQTGLRRQEAQEWAMLLAWDNPHLYYRNHTLFWEET